MSARSEFSIKAAHSVLEPVFNDLPWYRWWLHQQLRNQPQRLFLALPASPFTDDIAYHEYFLPVWNKVQDCMRDPKGKTIDSITDTLVEHGLLSVQDNYESYQSSKELVFSIIGWQTMLYQPDIVSNEVGGFNLVDETNGYRGEARICLNQAPLTSKSNISNFLLGFGMMLPPRDYCAFEDPNDMAFFNTIKSVTSKALNAHVLTRVCGVQIQWVDSLSCHLELDTHSGILFLFRYPSFCVSHLQKINNKEQKKGVIHCCGLEDRGTLPWATVNDVTAFLEEVIQSYRLIFGQTKRSRSLFRKSRPFANIPLEGQDRFLRNICGKKHFTCPVRLIEREEYTLACDFPHLRSRIVRLQAYASSKQPQSIRQLWRDKRDSTAWLAFWSVLIFGSMSIVLALIQTVFQIMQYILAVKQGES